MDEPVNPLGELAARLTRKQDLELSRIPIERTKEKLLAMPARRGRLWRGVAAAAVAAALVALAVVLLRPAPIAFELAPGRAGRVGQWIEAAGTAELPIRFSEGSTFTLAGESRARVSAVATGSASIILERGSIDAVVVHRPGARWQLDVGPYTVHVTGTRFRVRWDPDGKSLEVELREGSVVVEGPLLGAGRSLVAGETLGVSMKDERIVVQSGPPAAVPSVTPAATAEATAPIAPSSAGVPHAVSSPSRSAEPSTATWRELASAGWYAQAVARAEAGGFEAICDSAPPQDLMALADAARLAGNTRRAKQALEALRRRFATDAQAPVAAFLLGRLAFDQEGSMSDAERWFSAYLTEAPGGPFAREALGRQMEARARSGNRAGAEEAARRYLSTYPEGPHAEKARQLAGE